MSYTIRRVTEDDKNAVVAIFNYYIEHSYAAFFEKKAEPDFFNMLKDLTYGNSFYVIEDEHGRVIGFGLLKKLHNSEVFREVAELSYFIRPECTRRGLGTAILETLITDAKNINIRTLLASISSLNEESIAFHKKHGFFECGRFKSIGNKYGKRFDVIWMQRFI